MNSVGNSGRVFMDGEIMIKEQEIENKYKKLAEKLIEKSELNEQKRLDFLKHLPDEKRESFITKSEVG